MGVIWDEFKGVLRSILPISFLVLALMVIAPELGDSDIVMFLFCTLMILIGFTLFLVGVNAGVIPVGNSIGSEIPRRGSLLFMVAVIFIISFLFILAEPNVTVFSNLVNNMFPGVDATIMVYSLATGVAVFLIIGALKIIFGFDIRIILTVTYAIIIVLCFLTQPAFIGIAFDSGGVTTGPLTVPILLALGLGITSAMASRSEMDGFGMIGLASAGPIVALLIMGIFAGEPAAGELAVDVATSAWDVLADAFIESVSGVVIALTPLILFFVFFQKVFLKYSWLSVRSMLVGVTLAGVGIIIFLTGVYAGYMPISTSIGEFLSTLDPVWVIVLGMLLGLVVVLAEPAVRILGDQVEHASHGVIPGRVLLILLAVSVACLAGVGMARIMFDVSMMYIVIPGYIVALIMMWFSKKDMIGIAFDAGGVATGPMVVTVMMSMYAGLADSLYGADAAVNGFGMIAMVALAPILALSALGVLIKVYERRVGDSE